MTRRTLRAWVAATAALAVLAVACGDDGDGDDAAAPDEVTEAGPTAGATNEEASAAEDADGIDVDEAALQTVLDEWRTEVDTFGATLSVRVPGHDDVHLASGVDDRDPDTPMPTDGTYPVDDITKTFIAAIALGLVDEGRLSLDDPVEPWLPELPNADEITLAMLLDHTAGLGEWLPDVGTLLDDLTRSFAPEEVLAMHLEQPRAGRPGEGYLFTDAGYVAAGLLIERELDQDLASVIEDRLTGPLSLDDTVFSDGSIKPTRHGWFSLDDDPDRPLDMLDYRSEAAVMTGLWASRAVISSSEDLLDWGEALYSGDVLGEEATTTMLEMQPALSPLPPLNAVDTPAVLFSGLGVHGYCLDLETGCTRDEIEVVGQVANLPRTMLAHHLESGTTIAMHANVATTHTPQAIDLVGDVLRQLGLT